MNSTMSLLRFGLMLGMALIVGACTTYGVVENKPLTANQAKPGYSLGEFARKLNRHSDELTLAVAFSGGGTRAAALAYGVMQELRATEVVLSGNHARIQRWRRAQALHRTLRYRPDLLPGGLEALAETDRRLLEEFPSLTYP